MANYMEKKLGQPATTSITFALAEFYPVLLSKLFKVGKLDLTPTCMIPTKEVALEES